METIFLDEFSREVWETNYKNHNDKNEFDTFRRVAKAVASVEKTPELAVKWEEEFYQLLSSMKLCAGGRIIANAGTHWKGTTLMNCFVGPKPSKDQDSIEGILSVLKSQTLTLKSEGGWGMNFSFIRPRGSFIYGIGVETPGAVKYMELFDKSSDVITAGSGNKTKNKEAKGKIRKGAMMGVLDVWHPDIEEFITAKLTPGRLTKFNISVNCSNEFMDRVARLYEIQNLIDSPKEIGDLVVDNLNQEFTKLDTWDLIFPDTQYPAHKTEWDGNIQLWKDKGYPVKVYKTIKVSDLWDRIMQSTYHRNDPGVLFLDRANETHCWNYGGSEAHIAATNPCGEQCLPFGSVCNLASLNLTKFVENEVLNYDELERATKVAVRFLDNVNDLTNAPLPEYERSIKARRRIGLGVMGWGSALYMMRLRFASSSAEMVKKLMMETICYAAVETSIGLAKEKGAFEGCIPDRHVNTSFWTQIKLPLRLRILMNEYGIRNSALFSIQPTGHTSIFMNVISGGLEPLFLTEYTRTVILNHCPEDLKSQVPKYWEGAFHETDLFKFAKEGDEQILRGTLNGIVYKIDKNRGLTKEVSCVDYSVRKLREEGMWDAKADWAVTTANLTVDEHVKDMTGFGQWIDSSMSKTVNLPHDYPYEDFKKLYLNAYKTGFLKGITTYREGTMTNVLAAKTEQKISKTQAPKRPQILDGELHFFKIDKHQYYVIVGTFGGDPYEVFTGVNENKKDVYIPKSVKKGKIIKCARHEYKFEGEDGETYELTNGHSNETAAALSRMISCALRHGSDIAFIVHQLEKTEGPIVSFSKALARALKKYIIEGTPITGEECPSCNSKMVRKEGCASCPQCGHTKCA
jgi:ribonucleoside-diphosphate reductase alpha chain